VTASAIGRKGRHLTGTFCLTGDTMEGIIQCLVFLKAFSLKHKNFNNERPILYRSTKNRQMDVALNRFKSLVNR
ncbi:hypothetical protein L9F63_005650, partial [Diploptera punctata]